MSDRTPIDLDAIARDFRDAMEGPPGNDAAVRVADAWPALLAELRRLRSGVGLIACPDHGQIPEHVDPDATPCKRCGGTGAVDHEDVLAEVRAARERIAALEARERELVAALDEAANDLGDIGADIDDRLGEKLARRVWSIADRLRAIAHPDRQGETTAERPS